MSKRNLIITAIVLVILAGITQVITQPGRQETDDLLYTTLLPQKLVESFDEIVLESTASQVHLVKTDDNWRIQEKDGFPAEIKDLLGLVDTLTSSQIASMVTKDASRLAHFKLNNSSENTSPKATGTQLTLKNSGKTVYKLLIGKKREGKSSRPNMPSQPAGTYVRIGDASTVYLVKENLDLKTAPDDWIMKSIFQLEKDQIKSIRFEHQGAQFSLERSDNNKDLTIPDLSTNEAIIEYERNSLVSDLKDFKIDQIHRRSDIAEKELALKSVITISTFDEQTLTFELFAKNQTSPQKSDAEGTENPVDYFVTIAPSSTAAASWQLSQHLSEKWLFQLDEWKAKRWLKTRTDFVEAKTKK